MYTKLDTGKINWHFTIKSITGSLIILRNRERWQTISSITIYSSTRSSGHHQSGLERVYEYIVIEEIVCHLSRFLKMIKLLVILFIIKLSARNNIFKLTFVLPFFFVCLGFLSLTFTFHKTAGEGGSHF